jgi:hypothetical protein
MQNAPQLTTEQALTQVDYITKPLVQFILANKHVNNINLITPAQDVGDLRRQALEYDLVNRIITIIGEAQENLLAKGFIPLSYEEQIPDVINELINPNIIATLDLAHKWFLATASNIQAQTQLTFEQKRFVELNAIKYEQLLNLCQRVRLVVEQTYPSIANK